jgi:mono/diheme cytochrome c family protein
VRLSGHRPLAALAASGALAIGLLASGCGRSHEPDLANGKELFVQKCASCHVLGRANARGIVGPNLDESFDTARREGFTKDTVYGVVHRQIANVRRGSAMPPNLVQGDDAKDVASYVAEVAGQPGEDKGILASAGKPKVSTKPVLAKNGLLEIDADPTGALAFTAVNAIAKAGQVQLQMKNGASVPHNIAVRNGSETKGPVVGQGGTSKVSAKLAAGKYTFFCSVPGHEDGGMKGNLTVR